MAQHMLQYPLWLQAWIGWMLIVNSASILFLRHTEARWVLGAWIGSFVFMSALFELNGFNRLLGLSHVLWWTPLLIYLMRRLPGLDGSAAFARWLRTLMVTNALSLVVDYTDVVRYLLGERT
jgi:hypothetical protein